MESNLIQQTLICMMIGSTEFRYICLAPFGTLENILSYIKQVLNEVEQDMRNY